MGDLSGVLSSASQPLAPETPSGICTKRKSDLSPGPLPEETAVYNLVPHYFGHTSSC